MEKKKEKKRKIIFFFKDYVIGIEIGEVMEGFFCCRFTKYSTVAYLFGPTHLFELIKNEIISLNLRSFPMVFHFSAGYDPERVTETVPTSSGHDQTGQS